jgi:hypothetical protein
MEIIGYVLTAAIAFFLGELWGKVRGRREMFNRIASTPRQSIRDLL